MPRPPPPPPILGRKQVHMTHQSDRIARLYDGFYSDRHERDVARPDYVSPIRFVAGALVVGAIGALIFWGL